MNRESPSFCVRLTAEAAPPAEVSVVGTAGMGEVPSQKVKDKVFLWGLGALPGCSLEAGVLI